MIRSLGVWGAAAAAAALLGVSVSSASAAPTGISYVGELRGENGVLYSGAVDVSASIFGAASGGTAVWGPQNLGSVMVSQGLFSVVIGGSGGTLDAVLMQHDDLWLELTIDGVALTPRQRLRSVPYARVAASAQAVGTTPAAQIATLADLASHPIAAYSSATAPASPVPGQLWLNSTEGKVYVWSAGAWAAVSAAGLEPGELPGDGLDEVSNQTLSNEFLDVTTSWSSGPINIPDNNAAGVNAAISLDEGASAKLYGITIEAVLELNVVSQVQIVLQPPPSTGVNPITLYDGILAPTPGQVPLQVAFTWTPGTTPGLGDLLGTLPAGQWTLNVSDDQLTVVQPPLIIGKLTQFRIRYDVLRSDEVVVQGNMYVLGNQVNSGSLTVDGDFAIGGSIQTQGSLTVNGPVHSKLIMFSGGCTSHGNASGWNTYCLNGQEFNTAADYFSVDPNGTITVQKAGYYDINWWVICGGGGTAEADAHIIVNGGQRAIARCTATTGAWFNNQIRKTLKLNAGDQLYVRAFKAGQNYAFHQWSPGDWGGFQMRFLGE